MQVTTPIADTIAQYHFNEYVLDKALPSISAEEALRQPAAHSNHALWILGHMIYARTSVLQFAGKEAAWQRPWLPLFDRGAALKEASAYPSWPELIAAWQELMPIVHNALSEVPNEILDRPAPAEPPSTDGKISGVLSFFANHEAYHAGQIGFLTKWLGHPGPVG